MRDLARGDLVFLLDEHGHRCAFAVVIQSASFAALPSVVICPLTEEEVDAPLLRVPVGSSFDVGLPRQAWAMVELITAVPRERIGAVFGQISGTTLREVDRSMLALLGIA